MHSKQATLVATLVVFVTTIFGIRWLVKTQRAPGAITVVEAQAMDMTAMKAPPGVQPVTVEKAEAREVAGSQRFPATVMAYNDEEIVARVPGRVVSVVYPGDHVAAGQVVARIDAQEYADQRKQAENMAAMGREQVAAAASEVEVFRASKARAQADLGAANAATEMALAEKNAATQELRKTQSEADAQKTKITARQADLAYAEQHLDRQRKLYEAGVVSLNDYQLAQRAIDTARADLDQAKSETAAMDAAVQEANGRVAIMARGIDEARAKANITRAAVSEADETIGKAQADARATASQAKAAGSQSESAATIAGYTELRSLDDAMVSDRFVAPGSVVMAGQKLLMLHMASKVRIQTQLPEALAPKVTVGTPVQIHYGDLVRSARLTSIFPTADTATRTFTVEAVLDNPKHRFLPGSFATMSIQTSSAMKGLAVRSKAIQTDASGHTFVWIVAESLSGAKTDWTCPMHSEVSEPGPGKCPICKMELVPRTRGGKAMASRRSISIGPNDSDYTPVTGQIKSGDQVIVEGIDGLIEGTPVTTSQDDKAPK